MVSEGAEKSIEFYIDELATFVQADLRTTISRIEREVCGQGIETLECFLNDHQVSPQVLSAAAEIKRAASQIDVKIHALGILLALPHILRPDEFVESVSLGAGNTGRSFDLETNQRVAEFKFIAWKGGAESIRQNGVFKDFVDLLLAKTRKEKFLYLLGTEHALKFFNGGRALTSVLSKNQATLEKFNEKFGNRYATVREFYADYRDAIEIADLSSFLPDLKQLSSLTVAGN